MPEPGPFDGPEVDYAQPDAIDDRRVQCPNCCRQAFVTRTSMGLIFYACELCGTVGAMPERAELKE